MSDFTDDLVDWDDELTWDDLYDDEGIDEDGIPIIPRTIPLFGLSHVYMRRRYRPLTRTSAHK